MFTNPHIYIVFLWITELVKMRDKNQFGKEYKKTSHNLFILENLYVTAT